MSATAGQNKMKGISYIRRLPHFELLLSLGKIDLYNSYFFNKKKIPIFYKQLIPEILQPNSINEYMYCYTYTCIPIFAILHQNFHC